MNVWLILPGVVLIVMCAIPILLAYEDPTPVSQRDAAFRALLLVIGLLIGVALLLEGLSGQVWGSLYEHVKHL